MNTEKLVALLDAFEKATLADTCVDYMSGGFAHADFESAENDKIYIKLQWGVQSDCQDSVHTETWCIYEDILNNESVDKCLRSLVPTSSV